jgi:hypothetical protein
MAIVAFDTLKFAKRLRTAGFSEAQAEVIIDIQREVLNVTAEQAKHDYQPDILASKRDLKEVEILLKRDIEVFRAENKREIAELKEDIAETKADIIRWVFTVGILQLTVITLLFLKLAHQL